jgi:hypothetical protein
LSTHVLARAGRAMGVETRCRVGYLIAPCTGTPPGLGKNGNKVVSDADVVLWRG